MRRISPKRQMTDYITLLLLIELLPIRLHILYANPSSLYLYNAFRAALILL